MVIKETVAVGIVSSIADLRKGNDLEDFTVIVEDVSVRCHQFILAACSQFFRSLLRTDMQEGKENCAELKAMSHSTFTSILTALYTGVDVLTRENVIDIWHATHFLQIEFMVRECEDFVTNDLSLENYENMYHQAKMLDSKRVFSSILSFMLKNFDVVSKSQVLPELSVDQLMYIVQSDDLVVSSEDKVVEAVLKWVSHAPSTTDVKEKCAEASQKNSTAKEIISQDTTYDDDDDDDDADDDDDYDDDDTNGLQGFGCDTNKDTGEHNTKPSSAKEAVTTHIDQDRTDRTDIVGCPSQPEKRICSVNQEMLSSVPTDDANLKPNYSQSANNVFPKNERQKHLPELMSSTRLFLASPKCLQMLLKNPMIARSKKARENVFDAVSYQLQVGRRHGQWPEAARHRRHSEFENVLILTEKSYNRTQVYSFAEEAFFEIDSSTINDTYRARRSDIFYKLSITSFNNKAYIINGKTIYVYRDNSWRKVCEGPGFTPIPVSCESCIYLFHKEVQCVEKVNLEEPSIRGKKTRAFPGSLPMTSAVSFGEAILVFNDEQVDGKILTGVHCLDTTTDTWTRLDNIKGPAKNLISFRNDTHTYLLQTNGNLWTVSSNETSSVEITFCKKLWDFTLKLYCAVFLGKTLYISSGYLSYNSASRPTCIPGIADCVRYVDFGMRDVDCAPLIMPKKYFCPQK